MTRTVIIADDQKAIQERQKWVLAREDYILVESFVPSLEAVARTDWSKIDAVHIDQSVLHWTVLAELLLQYNPSMEIVFFMNENGKRYDAGEPRKTRTYVIKRTNEYDADRMADAGLQDKKQKRLYIKCFGGFSITLGREPVIFRTKKAEEIIAYLAHHRRSPVMRDLIIDAIWQEMDAENGINNFHVNTFNIRKVLRQKNFNDLILQAKGSYYLNPELVRCDLWEFLDILDMLRETGFEDKALLEKASEIYTGQYFGVEAYPWAVERQMKLEQAYENVQNKLYDIYMREGQYKKAAQAMKSVIAIDPLSIDAYEKCIRAYINIHDLESAEEMLKTIECKYSEEIGEMIPQSILCLRNLLHGTKRRKKELLYTRNAV